MDEDVIIRFDGEDDLTPKLDNMAAGFKRVTDAVDYLAELAASDAEAIDKLGSSLAAVGETAVPALTNLHNTFLILGLDIAQVDAQTNALISKNGELASSYTDLVASEKEQQVAMLTGLETQTLLQSQMGAALPVLEQTSQLYADMQAQSNAYMRSLGQLADVTTLSADATRTLADGTVVARESLQTAGGAALLAASQTRVYDESLRGVDVTLRQTASEQQAVADACNAATQAILSSAGATEVENTALRFSLVELESLTNAFKSSAVSVQDFIAAGYNIKDINAGLQVLIETGDASAAAMKVLTSEMGKFSSVAVPALLDVHNTFNILGQDITKASIATNELIAKNAELAGSYVGLTKAEQEQQLAMLTGLQTQNEARMGVVEVGDALAITTAEQLKLGEQTLKSMTNMYAQGLAAGDDAGKLAALRAQIIELAQQMDVLAESGKGAGAGVGAVGGAVEQTGLKAQASSLMFGNLGKEMEGVGGISQFLLFTLGMMAVSAGQQMLDMGLTSDDALKRIQVQTGVTDAQMQTWDSTIRDLGSHWGFTLTEAAQGLDLVTRAAFRGTDATSVLNQGMVLAVDTGSSLADSTNLLLMSMKSYGAGADQAANYTNILNDTFKNSRLTVPELTSLMGNAMPAAVGLGISLKDLGNAVSIFSQSTANGMIATRDFQAMLAGMTGFTQLDAAALAKLAGNFDLTKFSAMDFTAKLADLAKTADGNEAAFTKLIGGAGNAKTAMDNLDISTKQLAINAANLGVSFDPVRYNALDAAGKLLYLMDIVGDSGPKFAKLTDGTKATNTALSDLGSAMDKSAQHLSDMGTHFDMAKFKAADMAQQLHAMADFFGGEGTAAFLKYIGGAQNLTAAHKLMATEVDKHIETHVDDKQVTDAATHIKDAHTRWLLARDDMAKGGVIGPIDTKPYTDAEKQAEELAKDNKHQMDTIKADWSSTVDTLVRVVAPHIIDALHGLGKELNAGLPNKRSLMEYLFGDWQHEDEKFRSMMSHMSTDFMTWRTGIDSSFNQWRLNFDNGFRQWASDITGIVNKWRTDVDQSFRQWASGVISTISTWRSNTDNSFNQWRTGVDNTFNQWRSDVDQSFRQWASGIIGTISTWRSNTDNSFNQWRTGVDNTFNQWRTDVDTKFNQWSSSTIATISTWRSTTDASFNQWRTGVDNTFNQWRTDVDQSFRQWSSSVISTISAWRSDTDASFNTWVSGVIDIFNQWRTTVDEGFRQACSAFGQTIASGLSDIMSIARTGAANIGSAVADGLRSAGGAVSSAASYLAGLISDVLPHSPAKEGPLMHLDQFMPGMIDTLVSTMQSHQPKLQTAAMQLATSISLPLQSVSQTQFVQSTGSTATDMTPVVQILVQIYQVLRTQQIQGSSTGGQSPVRGNVSQQQMLATLYQMLNGYGGFTFESGARGAYAGLGV